MSIIHITYEEASKHFNTPIFATNAGLFCIHGPCSMCSIGDTYDCFRGLFISTIGVPAIKETKQWPSKKYADDSGITVEGVLALNKIEHEIFAAESKHPGWPTDIVHAVAIMMEEAGEAMQAALDVFYKGGDKEQLKKELAQTGAMAMRCLLHLV